MYWELLFVLYGCHHLLFCFVYETVPRSWWSKYRWDRSNMNNGMGDITLVHMLWALASMPGLMMQLCVAFYPKDTVLLANFDLLYMGSFIFSLVFWVHYRRHFSLAFLNFMFVHHAAGIACTVLWRAMISSGTVILRPWMARAALFWHGSALITTEWLYLYRFAFPGKTFRSFRANLLVFCLQRVWRVLAYVYIGLTARATLTLDKEWGTIYMGGVCAFMMDVLDIWAQGRTTFKLYEALTVKTEDSPRKPRRHNIPGTPNSAEKKITAESRGPSLESLQLSLRTSSSEGSMAPLVAPPLVDNRSSDDEDTYDTNAKARAASGVRVNVGPRPTPLDALRNMNRSSYDDTLTETELESEGTDAAVAGAGSAHSIHLQIAELISDVDRMHNEETAAAAAAAGVPLGGANHYTDGSDTDVDESSEDEEETSRSRGRQRAAAAAAAASSWEVHGRHHRRTSSSLSARKVRAPAPIIPNGE